MRNTDKQVPNNRILVLIAKFISLVINPNICQFFLFIYYVNDPNSNTIDIGFIINALFFLFVVPFIGYIIYVRFVLNRKNLYVLERRYRTVPFIMNILAVCIFSLLVIYVFKMADKAKFEIYYLNFINIAAFAITFLWRMSIHMMASSAFCILIYYSNYQNNTILNPLQTIILFSLIPIVGWSRYYLRGHTIPQIIGGTIFGISTLIIFRIFFPFTQ